MNNAFLSSVAESCTASRNCISQGRRHIVQVGSRIWKDGWLLLNGSQEWAKEFSAQSDGMRKNEIIVVLVLSCYDTSVKQRSFCFLRQSNGFCIYCWWPLILFHGQFISSTTACGCGRRDKRHLRLRYLCQQQGKSQIMLLLLQQITKEQDAFQCQGMIVPTFLWYQNDLDPIQ